MTQIRCPKLSCIYWGKGWCQSDEIELDSRTLSCITFEEPISRKGIGVTNSENDDDWDDLDWDEDEPLLEDEMHESLYENSSISFNRLDLGYPEEEDDYEEPDIEDEFEVVDADDWDSF